MIFIQFIGLLAFIVMMLSFYRKEYSTILAYQAVGSFLYATHYFLLGAITGTFIGVTNIARDILFNKSKKRKIVLIVILSLYLGITFTFYDGMHSIIPLFGSGVYAVGMFFKTKKSILIGSLCSSILWILYDIFILSYIGIITETALFISNTIILTRLIQGKDQKSIIHP